MQYQFCHQCGAKVVPAARFCSACGTPRQNLTPPKPAAAPAPAQKVPQAGPSTVFTLDSLDAPNPQPEACKSPVVFTLDSLPDSQEAPEIPASPAAPEIPAVNSDPESPAAVFEPRPEVIPPEPAPVPSTQPAPKSGILARRGVGRTVLAVLLCIVIFIWSFVTLTVLNVRLSTSGELGVKTLETAVRELDLQQIPVSRVFVDLQHSDDSLADWGADKINAYYHGRVDVDGDDLQELLEESTLAEFLAENVEACLADVYNGTDRASVTARDVENLLEDNAALIGDVLGEELSDADIAEAVSAAERSGALELLNAETLQEEGGMLYRSVQITLSWWVIAGLIVVLLLMILLLSTVERSVLRTLGDTGITLMVMSAIWGIGGLFVLLLPELWNSLLRPIAPIGTVAGALLESSLIPSAAAFGTGVVLVLIRVIGTVIVTKSASRQA